MAIAYPFYPDWSHAYSFSKTFKTGSAISRQQQRQRTALRTDALATIEYVTQFKGTENSKILHGLRNNTTQLFDVPDWRVVRPVTDIASMPGTGSDSGGTSYVEFEISDKTDYQPIEAGHKIMVWQSSTVYFVGTVLASSFDSTTITLELDDEYSLGTSDAPASADTIYCFRVFTCAPNKINMQWITDQICEAAISWHEASETPLTGIMGQIDLRVDPEGPDDGGEVCEPALINGDYLAIPVFDTPCNNPSEERPAFRAKDAAVPQTFFINFNAASLSQNATHTYGSTLNNLIAALASQEWECGFQYPYTQATTTSRHWHHVKAGISTWSLLTPTVSRWVWIATLDYLGDDELTTYTAEVRVCIEHDVDQSLGNDEISAKKGAWGSLLNVHVFTDELATYTDGTVAADGKTYWRDDPCIGKTSAPYKFGHPQLALTYGYQTSLTHGCTMTKDLPPASPVSVTIGNYWDGASAVDAKYNSCYGKTVGSHSFLPIGMVHFGEGAWDVQLTQPGLPRYDFIYAGLAAVCALTDDGGGCYTNNCLQVPDSALVGLTKAVTADTDVGDFDGCTGHELYGIGGTSRTVIIPGTYENPACYEVSKLSTATATIKNAVDREYVEYETTGCRDLCPSYDAPWLGSETYSLSINRLNYDWLFPSLNRKDIRWYYAETLDWDGNGTPYTAAMNVSLSDNGWQLTLHNNLKPIFRDDPDLDQMSAAPNDCSDSDGCPCDNYFLNLYESNSFFQQPSDFGCGTESQFPCVLQYASLGFPSPSSCDPVIADCEFYYPHSPFLATVLNVNNSLENIPTTTLQSELSIGSDGLKKYCLRIYVLLWDFYGNDCC